MFLFKKIISGIYFVLKVIIPVTLIMAIAIIFVTIWTGYDARTKKETIKLCSRNNIKMSTKIDNLLCKINTLQNNNNFLTQKINHCEIKVKQLFDINIQKDQHLYAIIANLSKDCEKRLDDKNNQINKLTEKVEKLEKDLRRYKCLLGIMCIYV